MANLEENPKTTDASSGAPPREKMPVLVHHFSSLKTSPEELGGPSNFDEYCILTTPE
jgi:hypothetical protein